MRIQRDEDVYDEVVEELSELKQYITELETKIAELEATVAALTETIAVIPITSTPKVPKSQTYRLGSAKNNEYGCRA